MTELDILYHDEAMILDYGYSRTSGAWVKYQLADKDDLDKFIGLDPGELKKTKHIHHLTIADGDIAQLAQEQENPKKGEYGKFWRDLIASGFFRAPDVLRCIGPEKEFEKWIRHQPSVLDGASDWNGEKGEPRNECAHVRRVSEGSGTAEKPPYFAVPLTHEQHHLQHQLGEEGVYRRVVGIKAKGGVECEEFDPDWFAKKADQLRTEWASRTLAEKLLPGCQSRSGVPPEAVLEWVGENGLEQYLPARLRG